MKLSTILIGGTALVGLGVYLSKKFAAKNEEDESFVYAKEKETYGEKIHKASLFAVGAIRTGADKLVEGIKDIRSQDMVKKGGETIESVKETAESITGGIKEKVSGFKGGNRADDVNDDDIIEENDNFFMAGSSEGDDEGSVM